MEGDVLSTFMLKHLTASLTLTLLLIPSGLGNQNTINFKLYSEFEPLMPMLSLNRYSQTQVIAEKNYSPMDKHVLVLKMCRE